MPAQTFAPRAFDGCLTWDDQGIATASFVTPQFNVDELPDSSRLDAHSKFAALYGAIKTPWTHTLNNRQVPISATMERMAAAVPSGKTLADCPDWQDYMAKTALFLANGFKRPPIEKFSLLSIQLPTAANDRARAARRGGMTALSGRRDLPAPPTDQERDLAHRAADVMGRQLAQLVPGLRPATSAELAWLYPYAVAFGATEPPHTHPHFTATVERPTLRQIAPIGGAELVRENGARAATNTLHFRTTITPDHPYGRPWNRNKVRFGTVQDSYQACLVLQQQPDWWNYPDAALCVDLDQLPYVARVTLAGNPVDNATAKKAIHPLKRNLTWTNQESRNDTVPNLEAQASIDVLDAELAELVRHGGPSVQTLVIITLAAPTQEELEEAIDNTRATLDPTNTYLARPAGLQTDLWLMTLGPGRMNRALNRYLRTLHPRDVAGLGLFHGHALGDDRGGVYGFVPMGHEDRPVQLVHRDPTFGPRNTDGNKGATTLNLGETGSGKTMQAKRDAEAVACLGGGWFAIDRSADREWMRAANGMTGEIRIIDPVDGTYSIDPFRVFTTNLPDHPQMRKDALTQAERTAKGYFAIRLRIEDGGDDARYDMLEVAVQDLLNDNPPLEPSTPNLLLLLALRAGDPEAVIPEGANPADPRLMPRTHEIERSACAVLHTRLKNIRNSHEASRTLFDDLPALDLTSNAIIYSMPREKIADLAGRANIYLAAGFALHFMYATTRFNYIILTELAELLQDHYGAQLADDILRQARRALAGLCADTQLGHDVPRPDLFITRTIGRTSQGGIEVGISIVGGNATEENMNVLRTANTGLKLYCDHQGRVGWVQALEAIDPEQNEWFRTDAGRERQESPVRGVDVTKADHLVTTGS